MSASDNPNNDHHQNTASSQSAAPAGQPSSYSARAESRHARYQWRAIDITVASAIGVASGLVFWLVDFAMPGPKSLLDGFVPGLAGILKGVYYFGGVLALIIVRKPGAGLYAEVLGSFVELALGNDIGVRGLLAGTVQGVFTEIAFLFVAYRLWNIWTTMLAGTLTAFASAVRSLLTTYAGVGFTSAFAVTHVLACCVSGAIISGALTWVLYRRIARTGALSRFASGHIETA